MYKKDDTYKAGDRPSIATQDIQLEWNKGLNTGTIKSLATLDEFIEFAGPNLGPKYRTLIIQELQTTGFDVWRRSGATGHMDLDILQIAPALRGSKTKPENKKVKDLSEADLLAEIERRKAAAEAAKAQA